jgi:hypothetical protein
MKLKNALKEFERHFRRAGDEQMPRTPLDGTKRMLSFYKEVRAADADLEADGDMLLFQWGTYDWGDGELFEFDIARQLIGDTGDDDDIWQLHLVYRFAPSETLRAIGQGDRWCSQPDEVDAFELFVTSHPAFNAVGSRDDGQAKLDYERAG